MANKTEQAKPDPKLKVKNLITYWRVFRSTELSKRPYGIEPIITDTIEVLEGYLAILSPTKVVHLRSPRVKRVNEQ